MTTSTKRFFFNIVRVFSIIVAVLNFLCFFAILTIPLGIFLIIGSNKLQELSSCKDDFEFEELLFQKKFFGWSIFLCIALFPIGLFSIVPYLNTEKTLQTTKDDIVEDNIDKLEKLIKRKEDGDVTDEEFEILKDKIINK